MRREKFFKLTRDTISNAIGYRATIGLKNIGDSTQQGEIVGYDDDTIHVKVGTKIKKFEFESGDVVLCVYQFEKGVQFVSELETNEQEKKPSNKSAKASKPKTKEDVMEMFYGENQSN